MAVSRDRSSLLLVSNLSQLKSQVSLVSNIGHLGGNLVHSSLGVSHTKLNRACFWVSFGRLAREFLNFKLL